LYELVTLLYALVGHAGYLAPMGPTCETLAQLLGEDAFYNARAKETPRLGEDSGPAELRQDESKAVVH
jgi:hypothetical protein